MVVVRRQLLCSVGLSLKTEGNVCFKGEDRRINPPRYQRFAEADGRALLMGKAWIPPRLSRRVKQGGGVIPSTFMHLVLRAFAAFSLATFVFSLFNRVLPRMSCENG
jgi:hypothetical protein